MTLPRVSRLSFIPLLFWSLLFIGIWPALPALHGSAWAQPATGAPDSEPDSAAAEGRWHETAYGMSLVPPPGTNLIEQFGDGSRARWIHPDGWVVDFDLVYSEQPVRLGDLAAQTLVQMGFSQSKPQLLDEKGQPADASQIAADKGQRIADRPAVLMHFRMTSDDQPQWLRQWLRTPAAAEQPWRYGQAIVMLEPYAAAVFKLSAVDAMATEAQAAFETMLATLQIPLADELNAQRVAQVEAGETWLSEVPFQKLRDVLPADAHFRLTQNGEDRGYLRLRSSAKTEDLARSSLKPQGAGVLLLAEMRQYVAGRPVDTRIEVFGSADGRQELWSSKRTLRAAAGSSGKPPRAGLPSQSGAAAGDPTWVETGVRGGRTLTVINERPPAGRVVDEIEAHERYAGKPAQGGVRGQVEQSSWSVPEQAYLPQLWLYGYTDLLPATPGVYAFYAYDPLVGSLGLRTVRVQPRSGGGHEVFDRPTPRSAEILTRYDAAGKFVERIYPGGLSVRPTTPEELKTIWQDFATAP